MPRASIRRVGPCEMVEIDGGARAAAGGSPLRSISMEAPPAASARGRRLCRLHARLSHAQQSRLVYLLHGLPVASRQVLAVKSMLQTPLTLHVGGVPTLRRSSEETVS